MSKLVLQGLGKSYGTMAAVQGVDLTLNEGEFVSLLGPSGCGKTTTLRMIAGFMAPTTGRISVDGTILSSPDSVIPPERRGMSMIFQSYAIWPNMTVAENVAFGLTLRKLSKTEITRRVTEMLAVVRLDKLAERYPAELSGGQQQRVALARAIVIEPAVLLLDEPLSNLDASLREEMRSEIRRLHDQYRITTVYVTHDQAEAMVTSDRIVVMNQGRIAQVDDPVSLYHRPRTRFVAGFIGRTNFLEGTASGGQLNLGGVTVPAGSWQGRLLFSLRPHDIRLNAQAPWTLPAQVIERAFLGEHWDYVVRPEGSTLRLLVAAPSREVHEIGDDITIAIDPAALVRLEEGEG